MADGGRWLTLMILMLMTTSGISLWDWNGAEISLDGWNNAR